MTELCGGLCLAWELGHPALTGTPGTVEMPPLPQQKQSPLPLVLQLKPHPLVCSPAFGARS